MSKEKPELELNRLRTELGRTRQDEIFGGLSTAELAEYNRKAERIHELLGEIHVSAIAERSSGATKAEQKRQWSKDPETDAHQGETHQPYRSREKDSADSSTDWRRQMERAKAPEEKGGE